MFDSPLSARAVLGVLALCAAASSVPALAAPGQNAAPAPRADDATAPVPETRYRAPVTYRAAGKPATTPDRHWREANRTVQGYNPMMLTMPERRAPAPAAQQNTPATPAHGHGHGHSHEEQH